MTRRWLWLAILLLTVASAGAQGVGLWLRQLCTQITNPVTGQSWCLEETVPYRLAVWDGTQWLTIGPITGPPGPPGPGVSGSPNQIAVFNTTTSITGFDDFTWNDALKRMNLGPSNTLTSFSGTNFNAMIGQGNTINYPPGPPGSADQSAITLGWNNILSKPAGTFYGIFKGGFAVGRGNVLADSGVGAFGALNTANAGASGCYLFGESNTVTTNCSTGAAGGASNTVDASDAFAFGEFNLVEAASSSAWGAFNVVSASDSSAHGFSNTIGTFCSDCHVFGERNTLLVFADATITGALNTADNTDTGDDLIINGDGNTVTGTGTGIGSAATIFGNFNTITATAANNVGASALIAGSGNTIAGTVALAGAGAAIVGSLNTVGNHAGVNLFGSGLTSQAASETQVGSAFGALRLVSDVTTPAAVSNGEWWVDCTGVTPNTQCKLNVRDQGATFSVNIGGLH